MENNTESVTESDSTFNSQLQHQNGSDRTQFLNEKEKNTDMEISTTASSQENISKSSLTNRITEPDKHKEKTNKVENNRKGEEEMKQNEKISDLSSSVQEKSHVDHPLLGPSSVATTSSSKFTLRMLTVAIFCHLGVLSVGYDLGVTSGAVLQVREQMSLSSGSQQILIAGTLPAAVIMTLIGSYLADKIGRKYTIMCSSVCYVLGAIILSSASGLYTLLVGRFLVGMGTGLVSSSSAIMVAEFSPSPIRGRLVGINQPFLSGGILFGTIIAGIFSYKKSSGWRYMWGLQGLVPSIQLIGFFFLHDSPRWLMQKGRYTQSFNSLAWVRKTKNVHQEIQEIRANCTKNKTHSSCLEVISKMFRTPSVRRALLVGCGLHFFAQFSGVNTVIYYSGIIVKSSGVGSNSMAIWNTAIINSCNLLFTLLGVWLVDKLGRRILGITSMIGIAISLVVLGLSFQLGDIYSPALNSTNNNFNSSCASYTICSECLQDNSCGYCYNSKNKAELGTCLPFNSSLVSSVGACSSFKSDNMVWTNNYCPTSFSWLAIVALAFYLMFYAPGIGPLPWLVNSEIYPLWARSTGNGIAACVARTSNLIISYTFLSLSNAITMQGTYWVYSGMAICGIFFIYFLLPELKGKTLEEIDAHGVKHIKKNEAAIIT